MARRSAAVRSVTGKFWLGRAILSRRLPGILVRSEVRITAPPICHFSYFGIAFSITVRLPEGAEWPGQPNLDQGSYRLTSLVIDSGTDAVARF